MENLNQLPEIPQVPEVSVREKIERFRESIEKVYSWVIEALAWLAAQDLSLDGREALGETLERVEKGLEVLLNHPTRAAQRAAKLALLKFKFSQENESLEELFQELEEKGILTSSYSFKEVSPEAQFFFKGRFFTLNPPELLEGFDKERDTQIAEWIKEASEALKDSILREQRRKELELSSQTDIIIDDLFEEKEGRCLLEVPPQIDEQGMRRPGGILLVELKERKIFPLDALGKIEPGVKRAKEAGVYVPFDSLRWDNPPYLKGLDPQKGALVQMLWHLIQRARKAEELQKEKEAMKEKADLSPREFLFEKKEGVCFLEFKGLWRNPDGSFQENVYFLIERKGGNLKLVSVPSHLCTFFKECLEEYPDKERFTACPQPLQAVLKAIYRQNRNQR